MSTKKFTVGQTLWWQPRDPRWSRGEDVTVTKVGRRWLELDNRCRVDAETLEADGKGYSSPARCYLSESAYQVEANLRKGWYSLKHCLSGMQMPDGMTHERINEARKLLGIDT